MTELLRAMQKEGLATDHLDYPDKVILRKLEKASRKGYINYGITMRSGWLTEKGKKYLEDAR